MPAEVAEKTLDNQLDVTKDVEALWNIA